MIESEVTKSTRGAISTASAIESAWRRLIVCPVSGSLMATTSATAASNVLPITPQRLSSTSSSRKKFASSSTSSVA